MTNLETSLALLRGVNVLSLEVHPFLGLICRSYTTDVTRYYGMTHDVPEREMLPYYRELERDA